MSPIDKNDMQVLADNLDKQVRIAEAELKQVTDRL